MLTQRLIVLVVITLVGLVALGISYRWQKSREKTPIVHQVPKEATEQRKSEVRSVRWLADHDVRLRNHFREIDPDKFAEQPQPVLFVEFLAADHVTSDALSYVKQLTDLRSVSFHDTDITDVNTTQIAELTNVSELNFNYSDVTDLTLSRLTNLTNLSALLLNGTHVTDEGLAQLHDTQLHTVSLYDTAVTDEGLVELSKLPSLSVLDVQKTSVTLEGVAHFQELRPKCIIHFDPY